MLSHYIELELSMKEIIVEYLLNSCKLLLIKVGYCIVNKISQFIVNKFSLFFKLLTFFFLGTVCYLRAMILICKFNKYTVFSISLCCVDEECSILIIFIASILQE